jgi:hypothetical protein
MGSGYRVFTAGEVLTASNVQNYLQDQAVMVFGGTAARSSAIGTANFEEGMLTYLTDVDKLQVYTGAAFADVYPAAATNQGLTLINTTSFSGVASVSLPADSFTTTYDTYILYAKFTAMTADSAIFVRLRKAGTDATGNNYYFSSRGYTAAGVSFDSVMNPTTDGFFIQDVDTGSSIKPTFAKIELLNPKVTEFTSVFTQFVGATTGGVNVMQYGGGQHGVSDTYDSATVRAVAGNISGTLTLYGVNK